jgi:hypothetical protein
MDRDKLVRMLRSIVVAPLSSRVIRGGKYCPFCGKFKKKHHDPSCPWLKVKRYLKKVGGGWPRRS